MFYGGDIDCIQGEIDFETLDFIIDLIEKYIELVEELEENNNGITT